MTTSTETTARDRRIARAHAAVKEWCASTEDLETEDLPPESWAMLREGALQVATAMCFHAAMAGAPPILDDDADEEED